VARNGGAPNAAAPPPSLSHLEAPRAVLDFAADARGAGAAGGMRVEYKKAPDLEGARSGAAPGWISRWSASLYSLPGVFAGAMENPATELMRAALRQTCRASRMRRPLTRSTPDQGPPGGAHLCRIGSMKMVEAITGTRTIRSFSVPIPRTVSSAPARRFRKNGGCPPADTIGLFLAFKCQIRMPPRRFEMAHPISQDYA
jgi:hypothetical protein